MDLDRDVAELYPAALRYALALTGSRAGAEDLLHEALIRLLGRARRATIDNPAGYLRTIITREYLRHRRRPAPVLTPHVEWSSDAHARPSDGGTAGVDQRLEAAVLLAPLSPRERAAIVARYYLDLPLAGVAELLGVSLGTAKATVSHGLRKLARERPSHAVESERRDSRVGNGC